MKRATIGKATSRINEADVRQHQILASVIYHF